MSGVGQIDGEKRITRKMINRQSLIAKTELSRLDLMIKLFCPAGPTLASVTVKNNILTRETSPVPAGARLSLESTSPQTPDSIQRTTSKHEQRIFLDDRDQARREIGGGSPTTHPTNQLLMGWAARLPALGVVWVIDLLLGLLGFEDVERGRVADGCPVCGRRG